MSNYKDKKTLDSSIAGEFDICRVGMSEKVPYEIVNNDGNWKEEYSLIIYNSEKKNTMLVTKNIAIINENAMNFEIEPALDNLKKGVYYFEIFNSVTKRVEFKGELHIIP